MTQLDSTSILEGSSGIFLYIICPESIFQQKVNWPHFIKWISWNMAHQWDCWKWILRAQALSTRSGTANMTAGGFFHYSSCIFFNAAYLQSTKCNFYHQKAKTPVWVHSAGKGCSSFKISFACVHICAEQFWCLQSYLLTLLICRDRALERKVSGLNRVRGSLL